MGIENEELGIGIRNYYWKLELEIRIGISLQVGQFNLFKTSETFNKKSKTLLATDS